MNLICCKDFSRIYVFLLLQFYFLLDNLMHIFDVGFLRCLLIFFQTDISYYFFELLSCNRSDRNVQCVRFQWVNKKVHRHDVQETLPGFSQDDFYFKKELSQYFFYFLIFVLTTQLKRFQSVSIFTQKACVRRKQKAVFSIW